jgi:hypothetical protein
MLARIALDPAALCLSHCDAAQRASLTRFILSRVKDQAILFIGRTPFLESELNRQIAALPQAAKTDWQRMLAWIQFNRLLRLTPPEWDGTLADCSRSILEVLAPFVDLVAVRKDVADHFGADLDAVRPLTDQPLELCRLDCLPGSPAFESCLGRRTGDFHDGDAVDLVWSSLFRPFMDYSDHFVIVDQYCVQRLPRKAPGSSGIECFLKRLHMEATPPKFVEIISAIDAAQSAVDIKQRLSSFLEAFTSPAVKRVELILVPDQTFKACVHYRFVRFNNVHCLVLDKGIEVLEGTRLSTTHLYTLRNREGTIAVDETRLRAAGTSVNLFLSAPPTSIGRNVAGPASGDSRKTVSSRPPMPGHPRGWANR